MSVLPPVTALTSTRLEPDAAYAQSFFSGCAAALSTLLNRSVTIELVPGLLPDAETLAGAVPLPWVIASARFTRGLAGAHDLVLAQSEALALARLVLGARRSRQRSHVGGGAQGSADRSADAARARSHPRHLDAGDGGAGEDTHAHPRHPRARPRLDHRAGQAGRRAGGPARQ